MDGIGGTVINPMLPGKNKNYYEDYNHFLIGRP